MKESKTVQEVYIVDGHAIFKKSKNKVQLKAKVTYKWTMQNDDGEGRRR